MPCDTLLLVSVPARCLRRPNTFFKTEPTEQNIVRVTETRRTMSVEALVSHTLELASSHPLMLLRVREREEHNHSFAHKRAAAISRRAAKKARGPDPGPEAPTRVEDEATQPAQVLMARSQPPPP